MAHSVDPSVGGKSTHPWPAEAVSSGLTPQRAFSILARSYQKLYIKAEDTTAGSTSVLRLISPGRPSRRGSRARARNRQREERRPPSLPLGGLTEESR